MSDDFFAAYKDPRWQRKRLEVMERAQFACERCKTDAKTLNVHHGYYERGKKPWEYQSETLHCLCEDCHSFATQQMLCLRWMLAQLPISEIQIVCGFTSGRWQRMFYCDYLEIPDANFRKGFAKATGLTSETVEAITDPHGNVPRNKVIAAQKGDSTGLMAYCGI